MENLIILIILCFISIALFSKLEETSVANWGDKLMKKEHNNFINICVLIFSCKDENLALWAKAIPQMISLKLRKVDGVTSVFTYGKNIEKDGLTHDIDGESMLWEPFSTAQILEFGNIVEADYVLAGNFISENQENLKSLKYKLYNCKLTMPAFETEIDLNNLPDGIISLPEKITQKIVEHIGKSVDIEHIKTTTDNLQAFINYGKSLNMIFHLNNTEHLAVENIKKEIEYLVKSLEEDNTFSEAEEQIFELIFQLISQSEYNVAMKYILKLIQILKNNPHIYFLAGFVSKNKKMYKQAKQLMEKGFEIENEHWVAHLWYAEILYALKDYEKSIDKCRYLIAKEVHVNESYELLGSIFEKQQNINEAIFYWKEAVKNDNCVLGYAYAKLADYYDKEKFYGIAERYFEKGTELSGNSVYFIKKYIEYLISRKRFDEAEEWIDKLLEINSYNTFALLKKGIISEKNNNRNKALKLFQKIITIKDCEEVQIALKKTKLYEDKILNDRDLKIYNEILISNELLKDKKVDAAIKKLENVIHLEPEDMDLCLELLGQAYFLKKRFDKALSAFQKALNITQHKEKFYKYIGNIFLERKKFKESLQYFTKAFKKEPENGEILAKIGLLNIYLKNFDKARYYLDSAEKLGAKAIVEQYNLILKNELNQ